VTNYPGFEGFITELWQYHLNELVNLASVCGYSDKIFTIVNYNFRGVAGIPTFAFVGRQYNYQYTTLATHEFSHLFNLNDEYVYTNDQGTLTNNLPFTDGLNCSQANVTPPWFIKGDYYPGTGLFKGCVHPDYYRPTENSIMNFSYSLEGVKDGLGPWNIKLIKDVLDYYR
jgi:hypothetical protein